MWVSCFLNSYLSGDLNTLSPKCSLNMSTFERSGLWAVWYLETPSMPLSRGDAVRRHLPCLCPGGTLWQGQGTWQPEARLCSVIVCCRKVLVIKQQPEVSEAFPIKSDAAACCIWLLWILRRKHGGECVVSWRYIRSYGRPRFI